MNGIIFNEFALLMSLAVIIGMIAIKLRQPIILSFIVVGIIAGPSFLGWIASQNEIEVLASFGVTLLLFIVGLKLDLQLIKTYGSVAFVAGLGQILLTTLMGFLLGLVMGMELSAAFFVAFALTFSSTIIIVKILSDHFEIDSLHGRISIGILIVQDLVVVLVIIVFASLSIHYSSNQLWIQIFSLILKGIGFLAMIGLIMRFIFPWLLEHLAKSRELLVLFAFSWAVLLAVLGDALGFGKEIGGFIAGVSLASSRYREAIASRLETVRNLLLLFFFLNLGASLEFQAIRDMIIPAILFSLFVLIGKPLIVMILLGAMRFRKHTGFLAGLTMGQLSEFSLILASLGLSLGYIDKNTQGLITLVSLITIGLSTYFMAYSSYLYQWICPWLGWVERENHLREDSYQYDHDKNIDVIIYGFGRHGENIAKHLEEKGIKILGIDFDPRKVKHGHQHHRLIRYGDAEDVEYPKTLPLEGVKWLVSTIPHVDTNQILISSLRELNFTGKIALSAYHEAELALIKKMNADLILVPYEDAAFSAAEKIMAGLR